jgi:hypothetical protein
MSSPTYYEYQMNNEEDTGVTDAFSGPEIERIEDQRYTAMLNKDVDRLNRVLHGKLLYADSSGNKHTKTSYIAGLTRHEFGYRRVTRSDQILTLQSPLALVFNFFSTSLNLRNRPAELLDRALGVWIHENSSWQLIPVQSSAAPTSTK